MKYLAYPWPEYQDYMGEDWFREESFYDSDKDTYLIPENRVEGNGPSLKHKLGDTVTIKSKEWYDSNCDGLGDVPLKGDIYFAAEMSKYCGYVATIIEVHYDCYWLDIDEKEWDWTDEMFEDTKKLKKGDKVTIKSLDWYNNNKDRWNNIGLDGGNITFIEEMSAYCGETATIVSVDVEGYYSIDIDANEFEWCDEMFE